jgi:pimeloyl-ACP methyl ester carboxylesterase
MCYQKILLVFLLFTQNLNSEVAHQPTTVFIHGTLFSLFSKLVATFDCPRGFYLSSTLSHKRAISNVPDLLHAAHKTMFPLDSFYLFGWSGYLDSDIRKQAARELYHELKKIAGPITLICHSHGGNVALNLAHVAQEHNDRDFKIEKLILLATPVQEINSAHINSLIFKKVYVLYSSADFIQILDPQNIYRNIQNRRSNNIFSQRTFPGAPHIIQAKIIINRKSPAHIDFMLSKILRHLPSIITLLDQQFAIDAHSKNKHYSITIKKRKRNKEPVQYRLDPIHL